jgi:hypothetical protein
LTELVQETLLDPNVDPTRPPTGTWYENQGGRVCIGVSHWSLGGALGLLAVSLFWNGIVSVFVLVNLSGTLHLLGIPVPNWFPEPMMNDAMIGVGLCLFLWIFLTPFLLAGAAMVAGLGMCLAGKTEIRWTMEEGVLFTGIGPLGWSRRFNPRTVREVRLIKKNWTDSDGDKRNQSEIILECSDGKTLKWGSTLNEEHRKFLASALHQSFISRG